MKLTPPSIGLYVFSVSALAVALLINVDWGLVPLTSEVMNACVALMLLAILSEAWSFKLRGLASSTTSIAYVPYLAGMVLVGPAWSMVVTGSTMFVANAVLRRKPPIKVLHNTAKEIVAIGVSAQIYLALGGVPSVTEFQPAFVAFAAAVLVFFPIDHSATAIAITLSTRTKLRVAWGRLAIFNQVFDLGSSTLAFLLVFLYVTSGLLGSLLVVIPLLLVRHVYGQAMRLERVNRDLLVLMVKSLEACNPYTSGHSVRVSRFARTVAEEMRLSAKEIDQIASAALLHDVGKIYQEFAPLLRKEGKLEPREVRVMQSHPLKGAELISSMVSLQGEVERAVRHHHEAFGGRGYPDRLSGQEIPLASRIIAVVDTFDAMTTTRPYRSSLSRAEAFAELHSVVGRQFDGRIVDLFCTNERIAAVIDEALREREPPQQKTGVESGELIDMDTDDDEIGIPKRRWVPLPSMERFTGDSRSESRSQRTA